MKKILKKITNKSVRINETEEESVNIDDNGNEELDITTSTQLVLSATTELLNLESEFEQMMFFYKSGITQICSKVDILKNEFQFRNDRNPIDSVQSRLKSMKSINAKMNKLNILPTMDNIAANLKDIAGVRIICSFVNDVYYMANVLLKQEDITLIQMKDYIAAPKSNGYRSLHLIVMVNVYLSDRKVQVPVEIQLRTIAMNFWASLEHQLRYKKETEFTEEMHKELKYCSEVMADADKRMQGLADKLTE